MNIMRTILKNSFSIAILLLATATVQAQDGEQLFKAKCNTCHMVDKNSTGPNLKGTKQKWTDAGEGDMIYDWVNNPQTLIASGKSTMATAIKSFSPTDMTPQQVTKEEIDAILNYVDTYAPPVAAPSGTDATTTAGTPMEPIATVPDYNGNLTLFYWLITAIVVLLISIIVMSTSITSLVRSDYFRKKLHENGQSSKIIKAIILILGFTSLMSYTNQSLALTFMQPGEAEKGTPWLLVESMDLYFLVAINVTLIGVLLYLRRMFNEFMSMARPAKHEEAPVAQTLKKINTILTDAVAIEEEHTILMQHEYDGIRELDNNLPPWWLWGFYATIVFAVIYLFNYHVFRTSDLQYKAYDKEMSQAKKDVDAYLSKMAMNVDETNATLLTDKDALSSGKALFDANCVVCHNPNGEGNIGPNLTDDAWIYGPDVKDLFKTIKMGTPNGMPEHASKLNPVQIQQVSSFVLSLPYTKGVEPKGKMYPKEATK
jgi:cytochrome c oxidase cbb3-type subunit 3